MLKDNAKVIFKEAPFSFKGNDGREVRLCKYHVVIDNMVFCIHAAPDAAEVGSSVPLTLRATQKGAPVVCFARPR